MSTDPLSKLYKGKCHGQVSRAQKHCLRTVVLRKALVEDRRHI
jgi:hypothetical protein